MARGIDAEGDPITVPDWQRPVETDRLAILASGEGSTFAAIVEAWREGRIKADELHLIATDPAAGAIGRAEKLQVPCRVVDLNDSKDFDQRGDRVLAVLTELDIQFTHAAGLKHIITGAILERPITNTHPAPMPDDPVARKYGGYKKIGEAVHRELADDFRAGKVKRAGSTIHLVDADPDHGPLLRVSSYDIAERARRDGIDPGEVTAEQISAWTRHDEKENNLAVLAMVTAEGRLRRFDDVDTTG